MLRSNVMKIGVVVLAALGLSSCSTSVENETEARSVLIGVKEWKLKTVQVNNKLVFKEGKVIEQFDEVAFSKQAETASFMTSGQFIGNYPDGTPPVILGWKVSGDTVLLSDTSFTMGRWYVPFNTLTDRSFVMHAELKSLNPPKKTKVSMEYVKP